MILLSLLGISILVALILAFIGDWRFAPEVNIGGSLLTFIVSLVLALQVYHEGGSISGSTYFFVDYLNISLVVLTTLVSTTTAVFSRRYMRVEREHGRVGHWRMRFYHAMFQLFIFAMLIALVTNNFGVLWISMELATLATVLLVSLYRTPTAIEAAWKYFILCGVGIAQ
ncbi:MAG: hydrogenase 4 subunit F, partial [Pelobacteraceae bacterium]